MIFSPSFTIRLTDCSFFAHHGVLHHEKIAGNEYSVSVELILKDPYPDSIIDNLDGTISYADIYEIIKEEMESPKELLESVAKSITLRISKLDDRIEKISTTIRKISPPIAGMTGSAEVSYSL